MLNRLVNSIQFDLYIKTIDPLLIMSGMPGIHGVDNMPIVTVYPGEAQALPMIPGSSLKGVFRGHLERIINTISEGEQTLVCIPYEKIDQDKKTGKFWKCSPQSEAWQIFCGNKLEYLQKKGVFGKNPPDTETRYRYSCPVCRLFGSTYFKGRIAILDAYLTEEGKKSHIIQRRDGIAIDRFTGGTAKGALFQSEVVANAEFKTSVHIRNFEIWQLGMICQIIKDLEDKRIRIGSGTSRGLGLIQGKVKNMTISFIRTLSIPENEIWGIGRYFSQTDGSKVQAYGLHADDFLQFDGETPLPRESIQGIRRELDFTEKAVLDKLTDKAIEPCHIVIDNKKIFLIPASSLKGMIRSVAEAVGNGCYSQFTDSHGLWETLPPEFRPCYNIHKLCIGCRLFGFTSSKKDNRNINSKKQEKVYKGNVFFSDARQPASLKPDFETHRIRSIGTPRPWCSRLYLSDEHHIAGRKFYYHHKNIIRHPKGIRSELCRTIKPDSVFKFHVDFTNVHKKDFQVLLYSLVLENGMWHKIGCGKADGFGSIKIECEEIMFYNPVMRYITRKEQPVIYKESGLLSFIEEQRKEFVIRNLAPGALEDLRKILSNIIKPGTLFEYDTYWNKQRRLRKDNEQYYEKGKK
ncbi:MAG: CRISPR-associated RAMP protein [Spirochaetales bacterium]|nr:CRISPR-associated RAMP protein [Spirochaetales bacterium]